MERKKREVCVYVCVCVCVCVCVWMNACCGVSLGGGAGEFESGERAGRE